MEHALGYKKGEDHRHDNDIIILLDPDQIIMRPFTNDFSKHPEALKKNRHNLPVWDKITHGQPFAQQYGFHNQWHSKTDITTIAKKEELPSPLESMDRDMINENFAAGPPYMATGRDFYKIADKWAEFGVGVHLQYPFLLAGTIYHHRLELSPNTQSGDVKCLTKNRLSNTFLGIFFRTF